MSMFQELFNNNTQLSHEHKVQLVESLSDIIVFDPIFGKEEILPSYIAALLKTYGWFWVSIDQANNGGTRSLIITDISDTDANELKYYDVADGLIHQIGFTDFLQLVKQGVSGEADLTKVVIRLAKPKLPGDDVIAGDVGASSKEDWTLVSSEYQVLVAKITGMLSSDLRERNQLKFANRKTARLDHTWTNGIRKTFVETLIKSPLYYFVGGPIIDGFYENQIARVQKLIEAGERSDIPTREREKEEIQSLRKRALEIVSQSGIGVKGLYYGEMFLDADLFNEGHENYQFAIHLLNLAKQVKIEVYSELSGFFGVPKLDQALLDDLDIQKLKDAGKSVSAFIKKMAEIQNRYLPLIMNELINFLDSATLLNNGMFFGAVKVCWRHGNDRYISTRYPSIPALLGQDDGSCIEPGDFLEIFENNDSVSINYSGRIKLLSFHVAVKSDGEVHLAAFHQCFLSAILGIFHNPHTLRCCDSSNQPVS
jgi:hypothetical protein